MHIIPAIDIMGGKAVRLFQGEKDREKVYADNPVDMAKRWADDGATYLHVVDLDGAFEGESGNEGFIRDIVKAVDFPVEVGGGVRSLEKAKRLVECGVDRVIVGTRALESREFIDELVATFPGKVNVGIDARGGMVTVKGWTETSGVKATELLSSFSGSGVSEIIFTDTSRDGALEGVNAPAMREACEVTAVPIIASGGMTSLEDIVKLRDLPLFGIIVGTALYEGRMTLPEAMAALKRS